MEKEISKNFQVSLGDCVDGRPSVTAVGNIVKETVLWGRGRWMQFWGKMGTCWKG